MNSNTHPDKSQSAPDQRGIQIICKNLGLQLSGVQILHDIDLQIGSGEIHCIIGPNGGGKTCFIRALLGQMPHSGSVEMQMKDGSEPVIGYLPQVLDFDKALPVTVNDFLAIVCNGLRPAFVGLGKQARHLSSEALARVGFSANPNTRLGSLSGGERQRVLFAQALIPEPTLLVLDEPMNNMDQAGVNRYLEMIRELAGKGVTIVWIAHDLEHVRHYADRVTCINRTVVFSGAPGEMLDSMEQNQLFRLATARADAPGASSTAGAI